MSARTICILLTDSLAVLKNKGEVKRAYYNPDDFFQKVCFLQYSHDAVPADAASLFCGAAQYRVVELGPVNFFNAIFQLIRTYAAVRAVRPSLLRAYDPSVRGVFCVLCSRLLRIPSVISLHSHLDEQRKFDRRISLRVRMIFEAVSVRFADMVICVSAYVREYAVKYGARRTEIVYNGVDLTAFGTGARRDLFGRTTVLCVARMEHPKYQECLIRAMKGVDADLVLIGSGARTSLFVRLIAELRLEHKVKIIPAVPHSGLADYYASSKIFAIPTHFEGFCIPLIEAMSLGIPVVASDIPPVREVLHGCGVLSRNTPEDFSRNINMLLSDQSLYARMSGSGMERARDFDMARVQREQAWIYEKLLAQ